MTTSEAVQAILDSLVTNYGDIELSAEDAKQVYGGAKASKVKDLSQHNLLQYALLHAHVQIQGLVAEIEKPRPNRAQRRAAEKKGLVLP